MNCVIFLFNVIKRTGDTHTLWFVSIKSHKIKDLKLTLKSQLSLLWGSRTISTDTGTLSLSQVLQARFSIICNQILFHYKERGQFSTSLNIYNHVSMTEACSKKCSAVLQTRVHLDKTRRYRSTTPRGLLTQPQDGILVYSKLFIFY